MRNRLDVLLEAFGRDDVRGQNRAAEQARNPCFAFVLNRENEGE